MKKNLFDESPDWEQELKPLIIKYKDKEHPLKYKNTYQLLVMVILSAQYSDEKVNQISIKLFKEFPNMESLSKATIDTLLPYIASIKHFEKKSETLLRMADKLKTNDNIPTKMKSLIAIKGIGRKSANVILRESHARPEGIIVDRHVIRVALRLGITIHNKANPIEKEMMTSIPKNMWDDLGLSLSFLGREICTFHSPKHEECLLKDICFTYKNKSQ